MVRRLGRYDVATGMHLDAMREPSYDGHRWRTQERGRGHEHECAVLLQNPAEPHECRCCCGQIDLEQWDQPRRKTPHLATRR